jgi:hypothetical protein
MLLNGASGGVNVSGASGASINYNAIQVSGGGGMYARSFSALKYINSGVSSGAPTLTAGDSWNNGAMYWDNTVASAISGGGSLMVRNNILGGFAALGPGWSAWTSYTPTVTNLTSVTVLYAQWFQVGKVVFFNVSVDGNAVSGSAPYFSLPVAPNQQGMAACVISLAGGNVSGNAIITGLFGGAVLMYVYNATLLSGGTFATYNVTGFYTVS